MSRNLSLHLAGVLLLKILEVVGKRASFVDKQVEVFLTDYHLMCLRRYHLGPVGIHHGAVVRSLGIVGKALDHEQTHFAKRHLLKFKVLDHKRGEIVLGHLIEQLVGRHRVG